MPPLYTLGSPPLLPRSLLLSPSILSILSLPLRLHLALLGTSLSCYGLIILPYRNRLYKLTSHVFSFSDYSFFPLSPPLDISDSPTTPSCHSPLAIGQDSPPPPPDYADFCLAFLQFLLTPPPRSGSALSFYGRSILPQSNWAYKLFPPLTPSILLVPPLPPDFTSLHLGNSLSCYGSVALPYVIDYISKHLMFVSLHHHHPLAIDQDSPSLPPDYSDFPYYN